MTSYSLDEIQREYWRERATQIQDLELKSIADPTQRIGEMKFILDRIPAGARILEIGCGSGFMTKELAIKASELICIDIQDEMINASKLMVPDSLHSKIKWICKNFHDFKADSEFDVVISSRVFINFPSRELQESGIGVLKNILKKDGLLFFLEGEDSAFIHLNKSRELLQLPKIEMSHINLYLDNSFFDKLTREGFELKEQFDNGLYDAITRVLVPALDRATELKDKQRISYDWINSIDWRNIEKYSRVSGGMFKLAKIPS
jgi:ubiquinone/menaquinone biosynthesis C-methylase UbiE